MNEDESNSNNDEPIPSTCPKIELGTHQNSFKPGKNMEKRGENNK